MSKYWPRWLSARLHWYSSPTGPTSPTATPTCAAGPTLPSCPGEACTQSDPLGTLLFALTLQEPLLELRHMAQPVCPLAYAVEMFLKGRTADVLVRLAVGLGLRLGLAVRLGLGLGLGVAVGLGLGLGLAVGLGLELVIERGMGLELGRGSGVGSAKKPNDAESRRVLFAHSTSHGIRLPHCGTGDASCWYVQSFESPSEVEIGT
jgi:hypothetical protein